MFICDFIHYNNNKVFYGNWEKKRKWMSEWMRERKIKFLFEYISKQRKKIKIN